MLLRIQALTKEYRRGVRANDDVSLELDSGQVLGLFGHNGAGKTTLLNQVIGLVRPTSGSIHIDGVDAVADPAMARRACSLQPQSHAPLSRVTPRQAIETMARIRGADRQRARERADELLHALDLGEWADTNADKLSGGVRRLTAFCMAAAQPGRIVMLDEPTNDVDPVRRRLLWGQIRALAAAGCAVILVTHSVVEAERGVARLAILHNGRIVAEGTPAELRSRYGDQLRLEMAAIDEATALELADRRGRHLGLGWRSPDSGRSAADAQASAGVTADRRGRHPGLGWRPPDSGRSAADAQASAGVTVSGRRMVTSIDPATVGEAIAWAAQLRAEGSIEEFSVMPMSLEDIYIGLTEDVDA